MATTPRPKQGSEHPEHTPDRNVESGVEQTFPASDPVAATTSQGSRAVPPQQMMEDGHAKPRPADDAVTLSLRFPNSEAAKLALEAAVREGPIDRRCASIDMDDDRVTMRLDVPRAERDRMDGLLKKHGGMEA